MQVAVKRSERDTPLQLRYPKWALTWAILLGIGFMVNLSYMDNVREDEQGLYLLFSILDAVIGWFIWYGITLAVGWLIHKIWQSEYHWVDEACGCRTEQGSGVTTLCDFHRREFYA